MDYFSCIARRTRRQTDFYIERLFRETSSGGSGGKLASGLFSRNSSSSRMKRKSRSGSEIRYNEEDDVFVNEREEDEQSGSGFLERTRKRRKSEAVIAEEDGVIFLGEGEIEEPRKSVDIIDVDDVDDFGEVKHEESDDFDDKGKDFDNAKTHWNSTHDMGVEVEPSPAAQKNSDFVEPITIDSNRDGVDFSESGSEFGSDHLAPSSGSSTSEDEDSSDEDYKGDNIESSSSGDSSVSCYDDDDDDENGATSFMDTDMRPAMEKHGRKVETESSGICRRNGDINDNGIVQDFQGNGKASGTVTSTSLGRNREEQEHIPSCIRSKKFGEQSREKGQDSCKGAHERKDDAEKDTGMEVEEQEYTPSYIKSKKFGEKNKEKGQDSCKDAYERKEHAEKDTGMKGGEFVINERKAARSVCNPKRSETHEHVETSAPNVAMSKNQQELKPSNKLRKRIKHSNKRHEDGDKINGRSNNYDHDKETGHKEAKFRVPRNPAKPKEFHIIELLRDWVQRKHKASKDGPHIFEEVVNDVPQGDTEAPAVGETLPLMFSFAKKPEPVEKSEAEKELDMLWEEMEFNLQFEEIGSQVGIGNRRTIEADQYGRSSAALCSRQKHEFDYDEQIGIYCKFCSYVAVEVRDISPKVENYPFEGSGKRSSDDVNVPLFDGSQFNVSGGNSKAFHNLNEGTVWDIIPNVKESMYAHQQEGFEFIWRNLAGTIDLCNLKNADPNSVGGCIISHAPGTGKTRLTIVFLQTYLELFPECRPVIIAPAGILLTWEDEFKKWGEGIPFHNLNNIELSGKEDAAVMKIIKRYRSRMHNKNIMRKVKLLSWCQQKSILGISYSLYEKLSKEHSKNSLSLDGESEVIGKVLHDLPGLLVLDEGHTPRNKNSQIWKLLSEIETAKRIILSGTPFQNNFPELYNTLYLVQPSFPDKMPPELKRFCQSRLLKEKERSKGVRWEQVTPGNSADYSADKAIEELKSLMAPFVHVHKGGILQKSLPGLRDCVVILNPCLKQKQLMESIQDSENTFIFEHKQTLVSIHPYLFLRCLLSEKEKSVINKSELQELKLNPDEGVKTKFLMEFVQLCQAVNEKVLVFSQYKDPLHLIIEQLNAIFHWSEGKEVLHMHGKLDQKQRQSIIHVFNDPKSQAKVLLASTRACSEGINLVGASRVVLLDVVWNPSVERQAISRAYRLGQKRVVYTYHLITQGTTECEKYCKQAEKERISELVFSARYNENHKQKSSVAVSEDKVLDQMVRRDQLKNAFEKIIYQPKELGLVESFGSS